MPPKKLSKKQLEKLRLEEEAEAARERAVLECAAASEAQRLHLIAEEESRNAAEAEKDRRVAEVARLAAERDTFSPWYTHRAETRRDALEQLVEMIAWKQYGVDTTLPNPASEKELQSMFTVWRDVKSEVPEEILQTVEKSALVMECMHTRIPQLADEGKSDRVGWYEDFIQEMQLENRARILQATEKALQKIESYQNKEGEVKLNIQSSKSNFTLWCNLTPGAKLPRVLDLEEADVQFDLPKLLSRGQFAIRVLQTTFDHVCIEGNQPDHDSKRSLGGVVCFDFFSLPPFQRPALHWQSQELPLGFIKEAELRHTNTPTLSDDGTKLEMPQVLALSVKFKLPSHVLVRESPPRVAWWDSMKRKWDTNGVENVSFNEETREISCDTVVFGPLAVVQSKSIDIPYRQWALTPTNHNQALLTIEMKTHTLKIQLDEFTATLVQPDLPELVDCFNKPLPPSSLAAALNRSGFTVHPKDSDIEHVDTLVSKEPAVEQQLHEDISMLVPGYAFRGSVWNQAAGRNKATVQAAPKPDVDIEPMTETYESLIHMWENESMKIASLQCSESAPIYKEKFGETHLRLEQVLRPAMPELCAANVKSSSVPFQECVRHMLDAVRLFSFC